MKLVDLSKVQSLQAKRANLLEDLQRAQSGDLSLSIGPAKLLATARAQGSARSSIRTAYAVFSGMALLNIHTGEAEGVDAWASSNPATSCIYDDDSMASAIRSCVTSNIQSRIYAVESELAALGITVHDVADCTKV